MTNLIAGIAVRWVARDGAEREGIITKADAAEGLKPRPGCLNPARSYEGRALVELASGSSRGISVAVEAALLQPVPCELCGQPIKAEDVRAFQAEANCDDLPGSCSDCAEHAERRIAIGQGRA